MTDDYGVMGHPIAHSKSPIIHARFAKQTGQAMSYRAIHVQPGRFTRAVLDFRDAGGKGLNVTLPFKEEAWELSEVRTARAEHAGAANTLWFDEEGRICGDNTDGVGLVRDLVVNHAIEITGANVLLLGAGGAARGVIGPLLARDPAELVIGNRTASRAEQLAGLFGDFSQVQGCGLVALRTRRFDLIINATSASLEGRVPAVPDTVLKPGGCCYDMMYSDRPTAFMEWGDARGASKSVDGLGMLVEQAAESFFRWRGLRPDTAGIISELRAGRVKAKKNLEDTGA